MMLEGGVVEDLSHMQNREPAASHISKSTLPQGKDIQEYIVQLTFN